MSKLSREQLQRGAKVERYRRNFPMLCSEQLWVKPKTPGPVQRFMLNPAQLAIEKIANDQVSREGYLRLVY
jgi:hypothetical protein